jgi:hypothetical protein
LHHYPRIISLWHTVLDIAARGLYDGACKRASYIDRPRPADQLKLYASGHINHQVYTPLRAGLFALNEHRVLRPH